MYFRAQRWEEGGKGGERERERESERERERERERQRETERDRERERELYAEGHAHLGREIAFFKKGSIKPWVTHHARVLLGMKC